MISLPLTKFIHWKGEVIKMIKSRAALTKDLESLAGKLNHSAFLIPLSRHFLVRLRKRIA